MKLKTILKQLKDVQTKGPKDFIVTGVRSDSRRVGPGNIFVTKKGFQTDGAEYIPDAIKNGAIAIVTDLFNPNLQTVCQIITKDPQKTSLEIAKHYFHEPDQKLQVIGITGTNGKTTTSYLIQHLFNQPDHICGLIGTIETIIHHTRFPSQLTTPDYLDLYKIFSDMKEHDCQSVILEVSSHGIEQQRIDPFDFDIGIFTNLSPEHLDFHGNLENYAKSKKRFFDRLGTNQKTSQAIINADDAQASFIVQNTSAKVWTYGIDMPSDVMAKNIRLTPEGSFFDVYFNDQRESCKTRLIGRHNIYNCLAAIATSLVAGMKLHEIQKKLRSFSFVPGRLQKVNISKPFHVFVDFAHTEEALKNVLCTLKQLTNAKIITLFGCGGDRDRQKRPKMAKVAEDFSDFCVVTSDNPRTENPEKIIQEILEGFSKTHYFVAIDRKQAIQKALSIAKENDIILIAGKGHEQNQIFAHRSEKFDDVETVKQLTEI